MAHPVNILDIEKLLFMATLAARLQITLNPPFVGARLMSAEQKADVIFIFGEKWKNVGNLDYVCCWYKQRK